MTIRIDEGEGGRSGSNCYELIKKTTCMILLGFCYERQAEKYNVSLCQRNVGS